MIGHSHEYFGDVGSLVVSISTPVSVTNKVCSNCAVYLPSLVACVHSSGHNTGTLLPKHIIGSIVKQWPGAIIPLR